MSPVPGGAPLHEFTWTASEKRIARAAFDAALQAELADTLADFQRQAAAARTAADVWDLLDAFDQRRRQIDVRYDYRYSRLVAVFGDLLRAGRLREGQLAGLADDKLALIRRIAAA